jgi:hypothetical protein
MCLFGVAQAQDIAIANATVYTSPGAAAQPHITVLIKGGKIVAVGNGVSVPSDVPALPCRLRRILEYACPPHWSAVERSFKDPCEHADTTDAGDADALGFATVVDTPSDPNQHD